MNIFKTMTSISKSDNRFLVRKGLRDCEISSDSTLCCNYCVAESEVTSTVQNTAKLAHGNSAVNKSFVEHNVRNGAIAPNITKLSQQKSLFSVDNQRSPDRCSDIQFLQCANFKSPEQCNGRSSDSKHGSDRLCDCKDHNEGCLPRKMKLKTVGRKIFCEGWKADTSNRHCHSDNQSDVQILEAKNSNKPGIKLKFALPKRTSDGSSCDPSYLTVNVLLRKKKVKTSFKDNLTKCDSLTTIQTTCCDSTDKVDPSKTSATINSILNCPEMKTHLNTLHIEPRNSENLDCLHRKKKLNTGVTKNTTSICSERRTCGEIEIDGHFSILELQKDHPPKSKRLKTGVNDYSAFKLSEAGSDLKTNNWTFSSDENDPSRTQKMGTRKMVKPNSKSTTDGCLKKSLNHEKSNSVQITMETTEECGKMNMMKEDKFDRLTGSKLIKVVETETNKMSERKRKGDKEANKMAENVSDMVSEKTKVLAQNTTGWDENEKGTDKMTEKGGIEMEDKEVNESLQEGTNKTANIQRVLRSNKLKEDIAQVLNQAPDSTSDKIGKGKRNITVSSPDSTSEEIPFSLCKKMREYKQRVPWSGNDVSLLKTEFPYFESHYPSMPMIETFKRKNPQFSSRSAIQIKSKLQHLVASPDSTSDKIHVSLSKKMRESKQRVPWSGNDVSLLKNEFPYFESHYPSTPMIETFKRKNPQFSSRSAIQIKSKLQHLAMISKAGRGQKQVAWQILPWSNEDINLLREYFPDFKSAYPSTFMIEFFRYEHPQFSSRSVMQIKSKLQHLRSFLD